jgi:hypothetical protein
MSLDWRERALSIGLLELLFRLSDVLVLVWSGHSSRCLRDDWMKTSTGEVSPPSTESFLTL